MTLATTTRLFRRDRKAHPAAPLRAVDSVVIGGSDERLEVRATKRVTVHDPYLGGHFPGFTVYPGVFVAETVLQAAAAALDTPLEVRAVRSMRFTAPLLADDLLTVDAVLTQPAEGDAWAVDAACHRRDGALAARVKLDLARCAGLDA